MDMQKVEQIRAAIAEGRLELDLDALSQAIVELHRA
ncbi:MAG: flagellar biosynthesis anti-sigma factor FlgM [Aeromonadaceae bacterium]